MEIQPFDSSFETVGGAGLNDEIMISKKNQYIFEFDIKKYKEILFRLYGKLPIEIVYIIFDKIVDYNVSFQMFVNEMTYKSIQSYKPYKRIEYKYDDIELLKSKIIKKKSCENEFGLMLKNRKIFDERNLFL